MLVGWKWLTGRQVSLPIIALGSFGRTDDVKMPMLQASTQICIIGWAKDVRQDGGMRYSA